MSDLFKNFSFDLQRFDEGTVLWSKIKGTSPSDTANAEGYYWNGSTSLIDGTLNKGDAVLSITYDTATNGSGSAYYLIKDVTSIDFQNSYTVGGISGSIDSADVTFANLSTSAGTLLITSDIPLTLDGKGGHFIFSGDSISLDQFLINTVDTVVSGITLSNGSMSASSIPENANVNVSQGNVSVKSIGDNVTV